MDCTPAVGLRAVSGLTSSRWAEVATTILPQGETGLMWCYCPLPQCGDASVLSDSLAAADAFVAEHGDLKGVLEVAEVTGQSVGKAGGGRCV